MPETATPSETQRIAEQLRRAMEGGAWHGPSVNELLADVTPEVAAARPVAAAHSIWEVVHHLTTWQEVVGRRLEGDPVAGGVPKEVDWPPVETVNEATWERARQALERGYRGLMERIEAFPEGRLNEAEPGSGDSFYTLLHGMVQHHLYHAGQIALLRLAAGLAGIPA